MVEIQNIIIDHNDKKPIDLEANLNNNNVYDKFHLNLLEVNNDTLDNNINNPYNANNALAINLNDKNDNLKLAIKKKATIRDNHITAKLITDNIQNLKDYKKHSQDIDIIKSSFKKNFFLRSLDKKARIKLIEEMKINTLEANDVLFEQNSSGTISM